MSGDIKENIEKIFNILKRKMELEISRPERLKKRIENLRCAEKAVTVMLSIAFVVCFSVLAAAVSGIDSVWFYFNSIFSFSFVSIPLLSIVLFCIKMRERVEILNFCFRDSKNGFPEGKVNMLNCIDSECFNGLCEFNSKELGLVKIQLHRQIERKSNESSLPLNDFIFSSLGASFFMALWKLFFNFSVDKKIDFVEKFVLDEFKSDNRVYVLTRATENWLKIYADYDFKVILLITFVGVILYLYKKLDVKEIEKRWHYNHVFEVLEYAICIVNWRERKEIESISAQASTQIPVSPPYQGKPRSFFDQLRNFICK